MDFEPILKITDIKPDLDDLGGKIKILFETKMDK